MIAGSRRLFLGATALAVVCLLGVAMEAGQAAPAAAPAQGATDRGPMTEEVFKQIQLLRGIPVDTFFDSMGMFANAMGNDCTFCHVSKAYFDKAASMRMLGDLGRYTQFQAAESMKAAAENPGGGAAAAGVGLGAGMAIGQTMMGALGGGAGGQAKEEDPLALIEKLNDLMKKGVISQDEFNAKKAELLKRVK